MKTAKIRIFSPQILPRDAKFNALSFHRAELKILDVLESSPHFGEAVQSANHESFHSKQSKSAKIKFIFDV
jgi:hypothetical protein